MKETVEVKEAPKVVEPKKPAPKQAAAQKKYHIIVASLPTLADAEKMVANGCKFLCEGSNMPTTNEAMAYLMENGVVVAPSKAVNAGGVSVSGLEMSQNSMRYSWTAEEVDEKLHMIMHNIFENSLAAAHRYGLGDDLIAGANIAGFMKVAQAMLEQGIV